MEKNVTNAIRELRLAMSDNERQLNTTKRDHALLGSEVDRLVHLLADKKAEFLKMDNELKRLNAEKTKNEFALRILEQELNTNRHGIY